MEDNNEREAIFAPQLFMRPSTSVTSNSLC